MTSSFQFLLLGGLGAVGAALAIGTLAAMVRYWRTGRFPGEDDTSAHQPVGVATHVAMWLRVVVGLALAVWGFVSVVTAGVF